MVSPFGAQGRGLLRYKGLSEFVSYCFSCCYKKSWVRFVTFYGYAYMFLQRVRFVVFKGYPDIVHATYPLVANFPADVDIGRSPVWAFLIFKDMGRPVEIKYSFYI
jgi:hypothetical protein